MNSAATAIKDRLNAQIAFLVEAIQAIQQDKMVDVRPLEHNVASICDAAAKAPKNATAEIEPLMSEMIGLLDQLALALDDYKHRAEQRKQ